MTIDIAQRRLAGHKLCEIFAREIGHACAAARGRLQNRITRRVVDGDAHVHRAAARRGSLGASDLGGDPFGQAIACALRTLQIVASGEKEDVVL